MRPFITAISISLILSSCGLHSLPHDSPTPAVQESESGGIRPEILNIRYFTLTYVKPSEITGVVNHTISEYGSFSFVDRIDLLIVVDTEPAIRDLEKRIATIEEIAEQQARKK